MEVRVEKEELFRLITKEYSDDIKYEIKRFLRKSTMEGHLYEDLYQESLMLLYTRLDTYDPSLSSLRTYTVRTTNIACLRYRSDYFKMRTAPDFVFEDEISDRPGDVGTILDNLGIKGQDKSILTDRINGYTLVEISERHDVSVNKIYRIMDNTKEIIENN